MLTTFEQFKTYYKALIQKVKSFRGNWNQNDPTADDYIKGRTHYSEIKNEIIYSNDALEIDYEAENKLTKMLVEGTVYTVVWQGETYECIARNDGYDDIYIGNQSISDGWEFPETIESNEPFFIATRKEHNWSTIKADVDSGVFNILISTDIEIVHKINEKYLPKISSIGAEGTGPNSEIFNDYKNNKAQGPHSHAEGYQTMAIGECSHAEGNGSIAYGEYSHAEGYSAQAEGQYSHAEGSGTKANGINSHAEGDNTYANGTRSHAEGYISYANGRDSHAEGTTTYANGDSSHSEGDETYANGDCSHAEGYNTRASGDYQHVQGKYNIEDTENKYAHIVGNGKGWNTRSNAHTIDWDGNAWFAGNITVGANEERLVTEKEINVILNSTDILVSNIYMPDQVNGKTYVVQMRNGTLVSMCVPTATITTNPTKMTYYDGDYLDTEGMVLTLTYEDGTTKEITEGITAVEKSLTLDNTVATVEYIDENGITTSTILEVTVIEFDPAVVLVDFYYTNNGDGTYTITGWKQTLNGVASTEMIVPNNSRIIV